MLPIIILAVITAILIVMFFYSCSVSRSTMHMAMGCEAGQITGKTAYYSEEVLPQSANSLWDGNLSRGHKGLCSTVEGTGNVSMINRGLLGHAGSGTVSGRTYVIRCGYDE